MLAQTNKQARAAHPQTLCWSISATKWFSSSCHTYKIHAPELAQSLYCLQTHKSRQKEFLPTIHACTVKFSLSRTLSLSFRRAASSSRATDWTMDLIQTHLPAFMWHFDYDTSVPSRKQTRTKPNYLPAPHRRIFHVGNFTCKGFLGW